MKEYIRIKSETKSVYSKNFENIILNIERRFWIVAYNNKLLKTKLNHFELQKYEYATITK